MASDNPTNQADTTPEGPKPLSPAARKRLQQCFERGNDLAKKGDCEYAHSMFAECVVNDPANLEYVEAMMDNLQAKFEGNRKAAKIRGFGGRNPFKKAVAAQDWSLVFRLGFELLQQDPWDVQTLRALADACKANRYNEVELRYLKNALDRNPKDIEVNKHCAESLTRMGQFDQAIACWHRIETLDKKNSEAKHQISLLTVAKTTGVPPGAEPPKEDANSGSQVAKMVKQETSETPPAKEKSEVEQLEEMVAEDRAGLAELKKLAEIYQSEGKYRETLQMLKRSLDSSGGNNLQIRELFEDAQIAMVKSQVEVAEKRRSAEKSDEADDLARRFRAELNRQEMQVFAARAERYPDNLKLSYELGKRLKKEGKYRDAATAFEKARKDSEVKKIATLELGECCQQLKQYGNAMKCYQSAIEGLQETNPSDWKRALYRAGVLSQALKNYELAENSLAQLVKSDENYLDAKSRLDKLREMHDKK